MALNLTIDEALVLPQCDLAPVPDCDLVIYKRIRDHGLQHHATLGPATPFSPRFLERLYTFVGYAVTKEKDLRYTTSQYVQDRDHIHTMSIRSTFRYRVSDSKTVADLVDSDPLGQVIAEAKMVLSSAVSQLPWDLLRQDSFNPKSILDHSHGQNEDNTTQLDHIRRFARRRGLSIESIELERILVDSQFQEAKMETQELRRTSSATFSGWDVREGYATELPESSHHTQGVLASSTTEVLRNTDDNKDTRRISYGDAVYTMRQPRSSIRSAVHGEAQGVATHTIEGLEECVVGYGDTQEIAREDFERQVHEQFQRIRSKRPLFRSDQEKKIWNALNRVIDISEYDRQKIITIPHEIGRLVEINRRGWRVIEWSDEGRSVVDLRNCPVKLAALTIDDWFNAVVQRRKSTGALIKILYVDPISEIPIYTQKQREEFWNQPAKD